MTTTDPKLIEPVAWMYHWPEDAGRTPWFDTARKSPNCNGWQNGWTETPLYTAAAINEAVQNERAGIVAWLRSEVDESVQSPSWFGALKHAIEIIEDHAAIEAHKESQHG